MQNANMDRLLTQQSSLYKTQQQAMAQKKILVPSDNPLGTATVLSSNKQLSSIQSWLDNINTLSGESNMMDSTFSTIQDKLNRLNELAISGSSGTNNADGTMTAIQDEVTSIKKFMVDLANTQYNGKYVFGGANTATPPYTLQDDGSITYNGTVTLNPDGTVNTSATGYQRPVEISDGTQAYANYPGDAVFGYYDASTNPPSGMGIFKTISDLENACDPQNPNSDDIRAQIDKLQDGLSNVSLYRTKNGITSQKLDMTQSTLQDTQLLVTQKKSDAQDLDVVQAYTNLSQQMYAYQASMQIASSISNTSLLNYM